MTPPVSSDSNDPSELWKGQSLELLKELHILTRDGRLNADTRRKLKQVYHLVQFLDPLLKPAYDAGRAPLAIDVGSGKSYLGFLLYDLVLREHGGELLSIESRAELVASAEALAQRSGFDRMSFQASAVEDFRMESSSLAGRELDLVTALHACDTATDDAILLGLRNRARAFAIVPCCQAETAYLLKEIPKNSPDLAALATLWSQPLHAREFGSHLTNVLRVLVLQAEGYRTRVTELVGWEHSLKNELILAERVSDGYPAGREKLKAFLKLLPVRPKLVRELET